MDTYPDDALKKDRFQRTPMQYAIEAKKIDAGTKPKILFIKIPNALF